jgi:hypothetical protein
MLAALAAAGPAHAQRVSGSLGVTATILPPIPKQAARLLAVDVERSGIVRLETAPPRVGHVTQIVMSTMSSSTNGFVPVEHAPVLVASAPRAGSLAHEAGRPDAEDPRMRFELNVGRLGAASPTPSAQDITVLISYLIVPGT